MPKHIKVCRGYINPSDIIIAEAETPCILNWFHAAQGNANEREFLLGWVNDVNCQ